MILDQIIQTYKRLCGFPAPSDDGGGADDPALSELLAYLRENWAIVEATAEAMKGIRRAEECRFLANPEPSLDHFVAEAREIDHRKYIAFTKLLAMFGERLDAYLAAHLVMDGGAAQNARLKLLEEARAIFLRMADFSKLRAQP